MQPALHEEVAISVRNTFLHYSVQDQGAPEGDGAQQPGLSRATTAPVTRPASGEGHEEEEDLAEEEDEAEVEPAGQQGEESSASPPCPLDSVAAQSSPDPVVLLGRLTNAGPGRGTEKLAGRFVPEDVEEFGKQPSLQRIVTHDPFDCRPCETDAALSRGTGSSNQLALQRIPTHDPFDCSSCDLDLAPARIPLQPPVVAPANTLLRKAEGAVEPAPLQRFALISAGDAHVKDKAAGAVESKDAFAGARVTEAKTDTRGRQRQSGRGVQQRTTVMLRNLPNNYTRAMLLDLIDLEGFVGKYDFLYLPIDFRTHAALGYAFVNLVSQEDAVEFHQRMNGFSTWSLPSSKVCSAGWSHPHQGLEAHVARYRNSPLMHEAVPDSYRPILFLAGSRIDFPPPTKKVKPPRQGTQRMLI